MILFVSQVAAEEAAAVQKEAAAAQLLLEEQQQQERAMQRGLVAEYQQQRQQLKDREEQVEREAAALAALRMQEEVGGGTWGCGVGGGFLCARWVVGQASCVSCLDCGIKVKKVQLMCCLADPHPIPHPTLLSLRGFSLVTQAPKSLQTPLSAWI